MEEPIVFYEWFRSRYPIPQRSSIPGSLFDRIEAAMHDIMGHRVDDLANVIFVSDEERLDFGWNPEFLVLLPYVELRLRWKAGQTHFKVRSTLPLTINWMHLIDTSTPSLYYKTLPYRTDHSNFSGVFNSFDAVFTLILFLKNGSQV